MTVIADNEQIRSVVKLFKSMEGVTVDYDRSAGTLKILDGEQIVYKSLRKDSRFWISRTTDSDRIKWGDNNGVEPKSRNVPDVPNAS